MKKTFLISLLSLAALSLNAQSADRTVVINNTVCKMDPHMPANARPVWPKGSYTALEDPNCPPCYEYRSKYGYMTMECPFLRFPAEHSNGSGVTEAAPIDETQSTVQYQSQRSYTGNYPAVCKIDPNMPRNAKPVWPKGSYTPLEDPSCPPCYEYRSKHGYLIMECPYLRFPAQEKD